MTKHVLEVDDLDPARLRDILDHAVEWKRSRRGDTDSAPGRINIERRPVGVGELEPAAVVAAEGQ